MAINHQDPPQALAWAMLSELGKLLRAGAVSPETALLPREIPAYDQTYTLRAVVSGYVASVESRWLKVRRYYLTAQGIAAAKADALAQVGA